MSGSLRSSPRLVLFLLYSIFWAPRVDAAERKAAIIGTPTANLRAGAGDESAIKSTLKEGDQVIIEKLAGEWYLVSTADGQKGYIHNNFLKIAAEPTIPVTPSAVPPGAQKPAANEVKEAAKEPTVSPPTALPQAETANQVGKSTAAPAVKTSPAVAPPGPLKAVEAKPQSILQIIEAHEAEFKLALLIAAMAFVLGWICGGAYYLRRERKMRGKLRF